MTILTAIAILPHFVLAVNDVSLNGNVNFQFNTVDAAPTLATVIGQNGGLATNIDVQSNYMNIT